MNLDTLIEEWGNYERRRIEGGSGYPKQTVLSAWSESQSHGGFGSRWPTGIQYKNLTNGIVKTRLAVDDLTDKYRNVIWYKYVGQFPVRVITEDMAISQRTLYNYIERAKKSISFYLANN